MPSWLISKATWEERMLGQGAASGQGQAGPRESSRCPPGETSYDLPAVGSAAFWSDVSKLLSVECNEMWRRFQKDHQLKSAGLPWANQSAGRAAVLSPQVNLLFRRLVQADDVHVPGACSQLRHQLAAWASHLYKTETVHLQFPKGRPPGRVLARLQLSGAARPLLVAMFSCRRVFPGRRQAVPRPLQTGSRSPEAQSFCYVHPHKKRQQDQPALSACIYRCGQDYRLVWYSSNLPIKLQNVNTDAERSSALRWIWEMLN